MQKYFYLGTKEFQWAFPFQLRPNSAYGKIGKPRGKQKELRRAAAAARFEKIVRLIMPLFQRFHNEIRLASEFRGSSKNSSMILNRKLFIRFWVLFRIFVWCERLRKYNLPVVIHMMDDWPAVRYHGELKGIKKFD